jgi:membrane protein
VNRYIGYLVDAVRRPREQLTRRQHQLRYAWELAVHCKRQLHRHRAEGMAAELTYRTIFALIPVVVLGLVMFRIVGGLDEVQSKVESQLYSFFGVPEIPQDYAPQTISELDQGNSALSMPTELSPPRIDGKNDPASAEFIDGSSVNPMEGPLAGETPSTDETDQQTNASIRRSLREVTAKVASLDFASIGVVGLLLFVYAAVALAESTESLFNRIYDAPTKRPPHIRIAIHWSIITLGSGLLAMSLYMSGQVVDWFGTMDNGWNIRPILSHLLSVGASWVLLFLLYALMPNTHVSVAAAVAGSFVGALLWEAAKLGFQIYVVTAVPYSAIYGSLGLIPLFLFWIYLTWLIVLFGLILTYTLQTLGGRRPNQIDWNEAGMVQGDPDWMLPIMTEDLADHLGLPSRIVHEMTDKLIEANLLRRNLASAADQATLTLAKPAEKIGLDSILAIAHHARPTNTHAAWRTLAELKQAERDAVKGRTLADAVTLSAANR